MAAIRFRWTVRLDSGEYYVDETIGENSTPVVSGPMSRDAAIQMVHDREADARRRFDQLKSEMTGRGAAADLARKRRRRGLITRLSDYRGGPRKSFLARSTPACRRMS